MRTKKVVTTPMHLNANLWRALARIVSTDATRKVICHVHVRDARTMEATDGHCAIQVTFPVDLELAPGLYDAKATMARIKANVPPENTNPFVTDTWTFPNIDQVMPKATEGYAERSDVGMNPELVSRVMDACHGVLTACGALHVGVTLDASDDLSPMLAYGQADGIKVRAAIMPMRVDEPRKRPTRDTFDLDAARADLSTATKRAACLESERDALREEIRRLTNERNEAIEAADTDAADAERARQVADELRAEINALRHLRPKVESEPVLLTHPVVRA